MFRLETKSVCKVLTFSACLGMIPAIAQAQCNPYDAYCNLGLSSSYSTSSQSLISSGLFANDVTCPPGTRLNRDGTCLVQSSHSGSSLAQSALGVQTMVIYEPCPPGTVERPDRSCLVQPQVANSALLPAQSTWAGQSFYNPPVQPQMYSSPIGTHPVYHTNGAIAGSVTPSYAYPAGSHMNGAYRPIHPAPQTLPITAHSDGRTIVVHNHYY